VVGFFFVVWCGSRCCTHRPHGQYSFSGNVRVPQYSSLDLANTLALSLCMTGVSKCKKICFQLAL